MKIACMSNVGIDTLAFRLSKKYDVYTPHGYNVWISEFLDTNSLFYTSEATDCFVILDGRCFHNAFSDAITCIRTAAKRLPDCNFYISNIDCPPNKICSLKDIDSNREQEYQWQLRVDTLTKELPNLYIFDLKNIIEQYGRNQCYSPKMWYISGNPYTAFFEKELIAEIETILNARYDTRKKCLVLDLDNTLWGGVIGEDGMSGIQLDETKEGARFKDFQKTLWKIKETGIILAIASKNNISDVQGAFFHPQMLLTWDDFVIHKINWRPKSQNIIEIATELNIGLESIVFVDDSPLEQEKIRQHVPEVIVAGFPNDTCKLAQFAEKLYKQYFYTLHVSDEDKNKSTMYTENASRNAFQQSFTDVGEFLNSIHITLHMQLATIDMLPRLSQLIQKTNQFNLTTKRHTDQALRKMMNDPSYLVFTGTVSDQFGDNGLTLLLIAKKIEEKTIDIDTFLMSCRIMGRTVEYAAFSYFEDFIRKSGVEIVHAVYTPTLKNMHVIEFYESMGYTLTYVHPDGKKEYSLSLLEERSLAPHYVTLI